MLCFITVALLASVVQSQTVPAEEVKLDKRKLFGFFGLVQQSAGAFPGAAFCAPYLTQKEKDSSTNDQGNVFIPRRQIIHDGAQCANGVMVLESNLRKNPAKGIGRANEIFSKLNGSAAMLWIGKETRTCGQYVLPNPTAVFGVYDPEDDIRDVLAVTIVKARRHMILTNSRYTCIYRGISMLPPATAPPLSSPSPIQESSIRSESVCFPGDAVVRLANGRESRMDELAIGDRVQVGRNIYSDVFLFTHAKRDVKFRFIVLITLRGTITLTPGHYLYVNGHLAAARTVVVGDVLNAVDGLGVVTAVNHEWKSGLYNPQTAHGDIVVNGIVATTFTTTAQPNFAMAALAPLRSLYGTFGFAVRCILTDGANVLAVWLPKGELTYAP